MSTLLWIFTVEGGLRAGWRWFFSLGFLIFATLLGAVPSLVAIFWLYDGAEPPRMLMMALQAVGLGTTLFVVTVLLGLLLDIRWVDGRLRRGRARYAGLGPPAGRAIGEIALGTALGALALVPAVGIQALGGMEVSVPTLTGEDLGLLIAIAVVAVFAAAFEEFFFRGYTFAWFGASIARLLSWGGRSAGLDLVLARRLGHGLGFAVPIVATSVFFGAAHLGNPGSTVIASVNTALAGLWLAVIVVRTRSLWLAIAAHWSWNVVHGLVLGQPVSGLADGDDLRIPTLLDFHATGPDWLGGGAYGVEGSVGATVAMLLFIAVSAFLPRRPAEHGMAAFVEPGVGQPGTADIIEDGVTEEVTDDVPWEST